jgi:hypothetical protein
MLVLFFFDFDPDSDFDDFSGKESPQINDFDHAKIIIPIRFTMRQPCWPPVFCVFIKLLV